MYSGGGLCTVLVTGAVSSVLTVCRCLTIKTKIVQRTTPTPFSSCLAYIKKEEEEEQQQRTE
jgi:hypothetical protein